MRNLQITPLDSDSRRRRYYHQDVLVTGQSVRFSLQSLLTSSTSLVEFKLRGELSLTNSHDDTVIKEDVALPVEKLTDELILQANTFSEKLDDRTLDLFLLDSQERLIATYYLSFTVVRICLDVDADRDGVLEENSPHKAEWKAGKDGYGAILLVNSDQDDDSYSDEPNYEDYRPNGLLDIKDFSLIRVQKIGPKRLPSGYDVIVWVSRQTANYVRIFDELDSVGYELVGPGRSEGILRNRDLAKDLFLGVEGLQYPERDFDGEILINLSLVKDEETLYTDTVRFQVAPWIMLPNTLPPQMVYVLRTSSGSNAEFIEELRQVVAKANCQLEVVPPDTYRNDRWMQDEIEIGYSESPGHFLYVVLDSPRNRGLDDFPEQELLGTDFGNISRYNGNASTLDSFGNLEVSPPVRVNGVNYPFGRILYGGDHPEVPEYPERMVRVIRNFLQAQKIQNPVELFSDWLDVGHIDEFMTFVPTKGDKGFKLLLASPDKCYQVLQSLAQQDHGDLIMAGREGEITIKELLADQDLAQHNQRFQGYITLNRHILTEQLGLAENDIIDLPALFQAVGSKGRAETYFPNMVNMLVLDSHLAIPKPFGPEIDGECQLEAFVRKTLNPLGLTCYFIDDWEPYFLDRGEIHCGSNVRRRPFPTKWWEVD